MSNYILSDSDESNGDQQEVSNSKIHGFLYNTINVLSTGEIIIIAGAKELKQSGRFGYIPMFYRLNQPDATRSKWNLESIPMKFEDGVEIQIYNEEFLHTTWVYLDKIYIMYLNQDNIDNGDAHSN